MATLYTDINPNDIHFCDPQPRKNGTGMTFFINPNPTTKASLTFQLPKSHVPFGVNEEPPNQDGSPAYKASVNIDVTDDVLASLLGTLDTKMLDFILTNKEKIFPGKKVDEWIRPRQFHAIKHDDNGKYSPRMKIKVILTGKNPSDIIVGRNVDDKVLTRPGTIEDIEAGCSIVPIVTLVSGWAGNIGYGLEFRMEQCLVFKTGAKRSLSAFRGLGEIVEDMVDGKDGHDDDVGEDEAGPAAKKQNIPLTQDDGADQ